MGLLTQYQVYRDHVHVCGNMHTNTHMCNRGEIAWQRLAIVIFLVLGLVA